MEMHTNHKQQIKQMLCNAICVLCQNTVIHNTQLTIEALIGITVDNGTDILLVSIKELLQKSDSVAKDDVSDLVDETAIVNNAIQEDDDVASDDDCTVVLPTEPVSCHAVVKQETTKGDINSCNVKAEQEFVSEDEVRQEGSSVVDGYGQRYNRGRTLLPRKKSADGSHFTHVMESSQTFAMSPGTRRKQASSRHLADLAPPQLDIANESDSQQDIEDSFLTANNDIDYHSVNETKTAKLYDELACSLATTGPTRNNSAWHGRQQFTNRNSLTRKMHQQRFSGGARSSKTETLGNNNGDWQQMSSATNDVMPEVTHMTLYTCTLCGAQMGRLDSFKRHKRSHFNSGQARCDICGKAFSRPDNMMAHRRRCASKIQHQALFDDDEIL